MAISVLTAKAACGLHIAPTKGMLFSTRNSVMTNSWFKCSRPSATRHHYQVLMSAIARPNRQLEHRSALVDVVWVVLEFFCLDIGLGHQYLVYCQLFSVATYFKQKLLNVGSI